MSGPWCRLTAHRRFSSIIRTIYSLFWILVRGLFLNSIRLLQSGCWNCWDSDAGSPSSENISRSMARMFWICGMPYILKKRSRRCSGTVSSLTIRCFLKNSGSYPDCRHWTCSSMRDRTPCPFSRISSPGSEVSSSRGISHWLWGRKNFHSYHTACSCCRFDCTAAGKPDLRKIRKVL